MKDKILRERSIELAGAEMGVWKESSINTWLPSWLRSPKDLETGRKSVEARRVNKFLTQIQDQKIDKKL